MKIDYDARYFSPKDVLECGQIFRFEEFERGYKVFSADRACYVYTEGKRTFIECDDGDYFYNFFDFPDYAQLRRRFTQHLAQFFHNRLQNSADVS